MPRGKNKRTIITETQHQAIHLLILGRFDPNRSLAEVADRVGVARATIHNWKKEEHFQAEYARQLALYKNNFDDIKLADRRERVKCMAQLYELAGQRIDLKLRILKEIRAEVGDEHPLQIEQKGTVAHLHAHQQVGEQPIGPNLPPRNASYKEWVETNRQMEATNGQVEAVEVEVVDVEST